MNIFKKKNVLVFLLFIIGLHVIHADQVFIASKSLTLNAQEIRLKALNLGFEVNVPTSLSAATIIQGKITLYPKSTVEVALRVKNGELQIKAQVRSEDARIAEWHKIPAKKRSPSKSQET